MKLQSIIVPYILVVSSSLTSCSKNKEIDNSNNSNKEQPVVKSHEEVIQEQLTTFEELADTIESVTDLESAKVSVPSLTQIGFKFNRLKTDLQNANSNSDSEKSEIEKKYSTQRQAALARVIKHMKKLEMSQPEAHKIINELMVSILR